MSWDDFQFSVRNGPAVGKSGENRMLQAMGGQDTIKKRYQTNLDGSTTMAHTRGPGSQPEFITTAAPILPLSHCAVIPVCNEAVYGFIKGPTGITVYGKNEETKPASALLSIKDTTFRLLWNRRKTKSATTTTDLHPGNRIWYDSRPVETRTYSGIVSWWCPVNHLQTYAISRSGAADNNRVWLGEQCVTTPSPYDGSPGSFMEAMKGAVFVDGVKVHTFAGYVLAAAKDSASNLLHAVTVTSFQRQYSPTWYAGLGMSGIKLVTLDLNTMTESDVVLSDDPWLTTNIVAAPPPVPQFSPDAKSLVFFKEDVVGGAHTVRLYTRVISTAADTLVTPTYWEDAITGGTAYCGVIAVWYTSAGTLEFLINKIYETDSSRNYVSEYEYGPLASASVVASVESDYSNVGSQTNVAGEAFIPLATDGFGSFLAGKGTINVAYGDTNSNSVPATIWEHYKDSPYYGVYAQTATEIPVHVLMPDNGALVSVAELPTARIPISPINTGIVCGMWLLPRPYFPKDTLVFQFSDAHVAATLAQGRFRLSFAVHPDKTKFIAGAGLVVADYWQLSNIPYDPLVPESSIKDSHACYVGVQGAITTSYTCLPVQDKWTGTYQFFNSPVFFKR